MATGLNLYGPHAEGMRYLLAQSPDTRDLVPDVPEAAWEEIGTKKEVKVRVVSPSCQLDSPLRTFYSLSLPLHRYAIEIANLWVLALIALDPRLLHCGGPALPQQIWGRARFYLADL